MVLETGEGEEQIAESVQVGDQVVVDLLERPEVDDRPLGSTRHRPRDVQSGGPAGATRKHELAKLRKLLRGFVDSVFDVRLSTALTVSTSEVRLK